MVPISLVVSSPALFHTKVKIQSHHILGVAGDIGKSGTGLVLPECYKTSCYNPAAQRKSQELHQGNCLPTEVKVPSEQYCQQ